MQEMGQKLCNWTVFKIFSILVYNALKKLCTGLDEDFLLNNVVEDPHVEEDTSDEGATQGNDWIERIDFKS